MKFKERHGCRLTCAMKQNSFPLFRDAYPDIKFLTARNRWTRAVIMRPNGGACFS